MTESYRPLLLKKAKQYARRLLQNGVGAAVDMNSFSPYGVKLDIFSGDSEAGKACIYYSPKKKSFRLVLNEIKDKAVVSDLEELWHNRTMEGCHIYVDGSYIKGKTGYGAVILIDGRETAGIRGSIPSVGQRQVAGEIKAVMEALKWCSKTGIEKVNIHYDYEGLRMWATGGWKAKQELTRKYASFVKSQNIEINWFKVDSHTGVIWNEKADRMAKEGAEQPTGSPQLKLPGL